MKLATEVLLSAAFALTPPEHWNQGNQGADFNGRYVEPTSPLAVTWCALGGISAAVDALIPHEQQRDQVRRDAESAMVKVIPYSAWGDEASIAEFNNHYSHAEVLDALYRAAELSEQS